MLDMQLAAARTDDPERAALYLSHAADEARHARVFLKRAADLNPPARADVEPRVTTPGLFEALGELDFLAYVHRGEARARKQFDAYVAFFTRRGRPEDQRVFEGILVDERRHESYTARLLETYPARERRVALRRARRRDAWERFRRLGRRPADALYVVSMALLYLAVAPLGLVLRWRASHLQRGLRPPSPSSPPSPPSPSST